MRRRACLTLLPVAALVLAACSGGDDKASTPTTAGDVASGAPATQLPAATGAAATTTPQRLAGLRSCWEIPDNTDSLDFSGAQYSEFPNSVATAWALNYMMTRGQYITAWTRDVGETWTIVGVSSDMVELQAELDALYPRSRVLVVNLEWTPERLAGLAEQLRAMLGDAAEVNWSIATGYVEVTLSSGAEVSGLDAFAGQPVCLSAVG
jgi:hypothetical protein